MQNDEQTRRDLAALPMLVEQVFAAQGPLGGCLAHYRPNLAQREYAVRVAKTLLAGERLGGRCTAISLLEAETGIGKSIGYLIPLTLYAALTSRRVAVSTYTLHLQRQLSAADGDLQTALMLVEQLTGKRLRWAARKGLRNFVSAERIDELVSAHAAAPAPQELLAFQAWARLARETGFGGELHAWKETHADELPLGLQEADVCLQSWDDAYEKAAYRMHAERAREADLAFITHALLLLNNCRWFALLDGRSPLSAVIVDEADRLEAAAETIYRRLIPLREATRLCEALAAHLDLTITPVLGAFGALRETLATIHARTGFSRSGECYLLLDDAAGSAYRSRIARQVGALLHALSALAARPELAQRLHRAPAELSEAFVNLQWDLKEFYASLSAEGSTSQAYSSPALRWSPIQALPSLSSLPLYPGRLTARLWQPRQAIGEARCRPYLRSCVLTSATLSAPGSDLRDFEHQVGIYRPDHHLCSELNARLEPDEFGQAELVLADPRAPSPTRRTANGARAGASAVAEMDEALGYTEPGWLDYCASMIEAARSRGGRVLVLATSYQNSAALGERVVGAIVHQPQTRLGDYLDAFRVDPRALWITPAAWEGLNLPGLISHLVITRLPFTPPDGARSRALLQQFIRRGMDPQAANKLLFAINRSGAKRRFRQGFGRAIRKADDRCTVWIADPRFPMPAELLKRWLIQHDFPALCADVYPDFAACIPKRFREGRHGCYASAEIWPRQPPPATAPDQQRR